jgi:hypothetical protein
MAAPRSIQFSDPAFRGRCAGTDSADAQRDCRAARMTTGWCPRKQGEVTAPCRPGYTRLAVVATEAESCP